MNFNILVIVAVCFIGCRAQPYDAHALEKYCEECMKDGSSSIRLHPYRCDAYITCLMGHSGAFIAYEMPCPTGLYFQKDSNTCGLQMEVCKINCTTGQKFKDLSNCQNYFVCYKSTFDITKYSSCAPEYKFEQSQQTCVADKTCHPVCQLKKASNSNQYWEIVSGVNTLKTCPLGSIFSSDKCGCEKTTVCSDIFKMTNEDEVFEQLAIYGWEKVRCIAGYNFNMTTCSCSDKVGLYNCPTDYNFGGVIKNQYSKKKNGIWVPHTCAPYNEYNNNNCKCEKIPSKLSCSPINMPLQNNMKDIYHTYIFNQNVYIQNNAAYFNGSAYLVLSSTSNNELQDEVDVRLQFKLTQAKVGSTVALFGNARCSYNHTFAIYIENALLASQSLVVEMVINKTRNVERIQTVLSSNNWHSVKVVKNGNRISVDLDNVNVKTIESPGDIMINNCAFGLGDMNHMEKFVGYMKNVYFAKCL